MQAQLLGQLRRIRWRHQLMLNFNIFRKDLWAERSAYLKKFMRFLCKIAIPMQYLSKTSKYRIIERDCIQVENFDQVRIWVISPSGGRLFASNKFISTPFPRNILTSLNTYPIENNQFLVFLIRYNFALEIALFCR